MKNIPLEGEFTLGSDPRKNDDFYFNILGFQKVRKETKGNSREEPIIA